MTPTMGAECTPCARGYVLQSAERAVTDSIQPAEVHSLSASISRLTLRFRLIDNEQSRVVTSFLTTELIDASRRDANPCSIFFLSLFHIFYN